MGLPPRVAAAVVVVAVAAASAGASSSSVRVTVAPRTIDAGSRLTITARVSPARATCTPRVTRPGASTTKLSTKRAIAGKATWSWTVPRSAKGGKGLARVTCATAGTGTARFTIVAAPPPPPPAPPPADADPVAGKAIFLANCGVCHTLRDAGTSGRVGPDLDLRRPSYDKVVERVTNGRSIMPSFRSTLTDKQIVDVAAYVSSVAGR